MKSKQRILGELEELVMEQIWQIQAGTVRQVWELVRQKRELAYTTVMTVMTRLLQKNLLRRQELAAGAFIYKPRLSREDFSAQTSRAFFGELLKKFGSIAVAQFVDALEEVDPRQVRQLKKLLEKK